MSDFDSALEYVHRSLRDLQGRGGRATATLASLRAFAASPKPGAPAAINSPAQPSTEPLDPAPVRNIPVQRNLETAAPKARPRAAVPILPNLSPLAPKASPGASSKAQRLEACFASILDGSPPEHRALVQAAFGVGHPEAKLMLVGEAPAAGEEPANDPFAGEAGQLLAKIIEAMGLAREDVFIANLPKSRPEVAVGPAEMKLCLDCLQKQIEIIQPNVIVGLGATALEGLLALKGPIGNLRGRWHEFHGIPLMPTYHPGYLLKRQSLSEKRKVWEDMLLVLEKLGAPISEKQRAYFLPK